MVNKSECRVVFESNNNIIPTKIEETIDNAKIENIYDYISLVTKVCVESNELDFEVSMNILNGENTVLEVPLLFDKIDGVINVNLPDPKMVCVDYIIDSQIFDFLRKMGIEKQQSTDKNFNVNFYRKTDKGLIERNVRTEKGKVKFSISSNKSKEELETKKKLK